MSSGLLRRTKWLATTSNCCSLVAQPLDPPYRAIGNRYTYRTCVFQVPQGITLYPPPPQICPIAAEGGGWQEVSQLKLPSWYAPKPIPDKASHPNFPRIQSIEYICGACGSTRQACRRTQEKTAKCSRQTGQNKRGTCGRSAREKTDKAENQEGWLFFRGGIGLEGV